MAASSLFLGFEENYVLPSSNSSKPLQYLIEVIGLDHGYSKPWSSQQRVPNPRPVKTMFSRDAQVLDTTDPKAKTSDEGQTKAEEMLIDVESVDDANPSGPHAIKMQYDVSKSKIAMGECERYVSSVSSKRTPDTWEELICRTGWTNQQNVLFDKILKIVSSYRLARLTHEDCDNEPVLCKVALDKATKRVRQILSRIEWDPKLTTWLHSSMIDGLSIPLLACYLDILQTLRSKVPSLVDQMIASPTSHRRVSAGTTDNMTSLLKRPWDATIGLSSFQRQRKVSGPPLLLIVPSGPTTNSPANATKRSRFWHHHMSNLGKVIPVTMHLSNSARGVSIGQCLDHMIGAVQAKVLELKNHFPNRPVVLIGWSTGALVSFHVSLVESVCAVVCLGFPLLGLEGLRGENEDPFLESKTPMMFVFGSLSNCCALSDIEEFRKKLVSETSLLVIGGADDQLRLTCSKKKMEGVTQSMVDRRIMDEIGEFLGNAVSTMNNVQNRTDYLDFDEIESRRKKPKAVKRKRAATNDTSSGAAGEGASKKPRKVATSKTQIGAPKKTKAVKTVKRPTVDKPIALGPTIAPGPPPVRVTGSIPISTLPSGSIPAGIVRGVSVPVSAVIKQGSLGGRSLVFSCPQPTGTTPSPTNPVPTMVMTSGGTGNAQHFNVVMSSTPGTAMMSSSVRQPLVQYKPGVVTSPLLARSTSSVTTSAAIRTVAPAVVLSSSAAATKTSAKTAQTLVTSPAMTSSSVTTGSLITPSGSSPLIPKRVLGSQGVASTPNPRAAAVPTSGQAKFIMRDGCLSAVTKPTTVYVSTPLTTNAGQSESIPSSLAQRVASPAQGKPQLISTTASDTAAKQSVGRLASVPVTSQTATSLVRRTPLPQSPATRTIQVGVTDPKKQLITKRTVTYSPSTTTKGITVVSRSVSSPSVPYRAGPQMKHLTQDLNRQTTKPLTSAQSQSVQLATALSLSAPSSSLQRASAQLVSASLTSAQAATALTKSALLTKSLAMSSSSTQASTNLLYQNSDDEKLVEKIRGIVKDVVGNTSRFMKSDRKQTIVVTTKSATTSAFAPAVTTATKGEAQRRLGESVKENKSTDQDGKK